MPFSREVRVRCSEEERLAWHRYATDHKVTLSELIRTMCNNVSGIHDPPRLEIFDDTELPDFTGHFHRERVRRHRRGFKGSATRRGKDALALVAAVGVLGLAGSGDFFLGNLCAHAAHTVLRLNM